MVLSLWETAFRGQGALMSLMIMGVTGYDGFAYNLPYLPTLLLRGSSSAGYFSLVRKPFRKKLVLEYRERHRVAATLS